MNTVIGSVEFGDCQRRHERWADVLSCASGSLGATNSVYRGLSFFSFGHYPVDYRHDKPQNSGWIAGSKLGSTAHIPIGYRFFLFNLENQARRVVGH